MAVIYDWPMPSGNYSFTDFWTAWWLISRGIFSDLSKKMRFKKEKTHSFPAAHKFRSLRIQIRNSKRQSFSLPLSQNFNFFLKTLLDHLFYFISIENTAAMHDRLTNHAFGRAGWSEIHTERISAIFTEQPVHHRYHHELKENRGVHRKLHSEFQVRDAENQWVQQKRFQAGRGGEFGFSRDLIGT